MPARTKPAPPPSAADVLDQLRERVAADGRPQARIARELDPPMAATQLGAYLAGDREPTLRTLLRIAYGLRPPWCPVDLSE